MLTGWLIAALDCALFGETLFTFDEQLLALATALATFGI
jgi:hypothetical protein